MKSKSLRIEKTLVLSLLIMCILSCSKNSTSKTTKTADEKLTSKTWKIIEDHGLFNSTIINYQRGQSSNSQNLDGDSIRFNMDGTGSQWTGNSPTIIPISWHFTNDQKNQLNVMLKFTSTFSLSYQWDFYLIGEDSLKYNASFSANGNSDFETIIRVPN